MKDKKKRIEQVAVSSPLYIYLQILIMEKTYGIIRGRYDDHHLPDHL